MNKDKKKKIPIKIDMSVFFQDERSKILLMFNPDWETVEGLQRRVETLFGVDSVQFLSEDGCFVPPQESIDVIKFCTSLKAFIPNEKPQKKNNKKLRKAKKIRSESESEDYPQKRADSNDNSPPDSSQKKRKYRVLQGDLTSSTPNNSKRIKNSGELKTITPLKLQHVKSAEISSTSEQLPQQSLSRLESKSRKTQADVSSVTLAEEASGGETVSVENVSPLLVAPSVSGDNYNHSKSTKEKSINEDVEMATPPALPTSLPSSTFINESSSSTKKSVAKKTKNPFKNQSTNKKHFYFDESGEITTTTLINTSEILEKTIENKETKVIFQCALNDSDPKRRRIFHLKPTKPENKTSVKQPIQIQEIIALTPLNLPIDLNKSDVFETQHNNTHELDADSPSPNSSDHSVKNSAKDDKAEDINPEKRNMSDEENISLNDTATTASTTIDNFKLPTVEKSLEKQSYRKDNNKSLNHTSYVEDDDCSKVNEAEESSIASVDCVDLSIDMDDDEEFKLIPNISKTLVDVSTYDSSDVEEVSEIIDLNESEDSPHTSNSFANKSNNKPVKVRTIMPLCKQMEQLPDIGDIVIFKIPYINVKGNSCSTDFLAGKAEYINNRTKTIKLLIMDGHSELSRVPGKFLTNLDNSMCQQKYVQIKASDMINPKIMSKK